MVLFYFTQLKPGIELLETSSFSAVISQGSLSHLSPSVKTVCTGSDVETALYLAPPVR